MSQKKRLIFMLALIIIALLVAVIVLELQKKTKVPSGSGEQLPANEYIPAAGTASSAPRTWEETDFRKAVPEGVKVPEPSDIIPGNLSEEIAVPTVAASSSPNTDSKIRLFEVRGEGGKFIPAKIIANLNDTVHIDFVAVDRDYDLVFTGYNMKGVVKQGVKQPLEFRAEQDGRFSFYCESCGGSDETPQGEIIIVP